MNIFEFNSYREVIKASIEESKRFSGKKITYQELAENLRIQKSYFSKVMAGNAELSRDQAFLYTQHFNFNDLDREYFELLVELERTSLKDYRKILSKKVKKLQHQNTQSLKYLKEKTGKQLTSDQLQRYYLLPETQLIHLSLGLPVIQKDPSVLKNIFGVSEEILTNCINTLKELDLIEDDGDLIKTKRSNMHLNNGSEFFHQWHTQFKLKSLEKLKSLSSEDKYNFLVTFSSKEKDKEKIRIEFLNFIKKVESIVKKSEKENLYQMNFDLFKWI